MTENRPVISTSSVLESPLKADARGPDTHASPQRPGKQIDKAHIEALIAKDYVGLRLLITRRTGDLQVAEDLLNDAACTTWQKWQAGQIERPEQIAGYIFQVAMNLLRNHRRSIAERPEKRADAKALQGLAQEELPEGQGIEEHIAVQVKHLLRSMDSPRDRTILVRFYLDEEDRESICRDLGMTPAQFARVIHRARGRLRQLLESRGMKGSDLYSLFLVM